MPNKLLGVVAVHVVIGATICQLVDQCVLSVLGIALLTLFMGQFSLWLLSNILRRPLISTCTDKAVLITGKFQLKK
jgi:hypothetical protein